MRNAVAAIAMTWLSLSAAGQTDVADFIPDPRTQTEVDLNNVNEENLAQVNRALREQGALRDAFFDTAETTLDAEAQAALQATANWLLENPELDVIIEGHADERGSEQLNLAIGDRRAAIAKEFLIRLGIASERLRTVSYGEERPFEEGHDVSGWAQNRRAHVTLVLPIGPTNTGTINGSVKSVAGVSITGATIIVTDARGNDRRLTSDNVGRFSKSGLTPGKYQVSAESQGYVRTSKKVSLQKRSTVVASFNLAPMP